MDDPWIERLERVAFEYFLEQHHGHNGLIADSSRAGSPVSIAVVGFALASYPVGVERGWITRREAALRTRRALRFFHDSANDGSEHATGLCGFYFHFLDPETGRRAWASELSLVDTALLVAGMLTAQAYFGEKSPLEDEIRTLVDALYRRIDWPWARNGGATLSHGWMPECGFLHYGWEGLSEASLLYVLALGSPTHPLDRASYRAWGTTYQWENLYDREVLYAGPLFIHQYSHAWIDFRGIRDRFMRGRGSDYFENSKRAIRVQQEYCRRNPHGFSGYGANAWGLSACEGPRGTVRREDGTTLTLTGYAARGVPFGPDDGTLCPSAIVASLPFEPELALEALRHVRDRHPRVLEGDRLPSGFNPTLADGEGSPWISEGRLGLDQGIAVLMIENARSELIWRLMRRCPPIVTGLRRAGFTGAWLARSRP